MDVSIFLARFFGFYCLIFSLLMFFRSRQMKRMTDDFIHDRGLLAFSGIIALMIGIAIVSTHNIWELNWKGLITLFGYLSLFKGIMRLGFPSEAISMVERAIDGNKIFAWAFVNLAIGIYLIYAGYA